MRANSGRLHIEAADLDDGKRSPEQKLCVAVLVMAGYGLVSWRNTPLDCYKFKNLKDPTISIARHKEKIAELEAWFYSDSRKKHSLLWWAFRAGVDPRATQKGLIRQFNVKAPID